MHPRLHLPRRQQQHLLLPPPLAINTYGITPLQLFFSHRRCRSQTNIVPVSLYLINHPFLSFSTYPLLIVLSLRHRGPDATRSIQQPPDHFLRFLNCLCSTRRNPDVLRLLLLQPFSRVVTGGIIALLVYPRLAGNGVLVGTVVRCLLFHPFRSWCPHQPHLPLLMRRRRP